MRRDMLTSFTVRNLKICWLLQTFLRQTRPIPAALQEGFCDGRNSKEEHPTEMDCNVPCDGLRQWRGFDCFGKKLGILHEFNLPG